MLCIDKGRRTKTIKSPTQPSVLSTQVSDATSVSWLQITFKLNGVCIVLRQAKWQESIISYLNKLCSMPQLQPYLNICLQFQKFQKCIHIHWQHSTLCIKDDYSKVYHCFDGLKRLLWANEYKDLISTQNKIVILNSNHCFYTDRLPSFLLSLSC